MSQYPKIAGFNNNSEIEDFLFAPTIFLEGCNFRCPYCMNANIVLNQLSEDKFNELNDYLNTEKPTWVVISGGEPTLHLENGSLLTLIMYLKQMNCKIALCTNGSRKDAIQFLLGLKILNYIALDIKTSHSNFNLGDNYKIHNVLATKSLLPVEKANNKDFEYEIRTTLYPPFIDLDAINEIGGVIRKDEKWVLQQFRKNKVMLSEEAKNIEPYLISSVNRLVEEAKKYSDHVVLRYV